jgi:hypothetical protein
MAGFGISDVEHSVSDSRQLIAKTNLMETEGLRFLLIWPFYEFLSTSDIYVRTHACM